jgi:peptide/nickel transport system substrate-binding protein
MRRRDLLKSVLASAVAPAASSVMPRPAKADGSSILQFIPSSDLATLDPMFTTASVTRCHALLMFDTLYGMDNNFAANPQMVAGHAVDKDGHQWDLTLREGLRFHDGSPVLARDAVASIQRWWKRDAFGAVLASRTDELSAPSDTVIRFRLKKPFALLPDALAVIISVPVIMPERLARTDPYKEVTEMIGSGPFRFKADERVSGSRVVYEKFEGYLPRDNGKAEFASGPKVAHFDRIEWTVMPDAATAAGALTAGEFDWWENPALDLVPQLRRQANLTVAVKDRTSASGIMRFNQLFPPFDKPAIRRLVVSAVNQREFMDAVAGGVPELTLDRVGIFVPGTPMASDAGLQDVGSVPDPSTLRKALAEAGYNGEKVVALGAVDSPTLNALSQVGTDMLKRMGFNVELQSLDWGTVQQRRASREPIANGGWSLFFTFQTSTQNISPAAATSLRADGKGWYGWPVDQEMEALRSAWFDAADLPAQQKISRDIQTRFFENPSFAPLGSYFQPTAYHSSLLDIREGPPQFYGVRRG